MKWAKGLVLCCDAAYGSLQIDLTVIAMKRNRVKEFEISIPGEINCWNGGSSDYTTSQDDHSSWPFNDT